MDEKQKLSNREEDHYQTVTLVLTDGRKVHYTGPAQIDPSGQAVQIVDIIISKLIPLPANTYFETINPMGENKV